MQEPSATETPKWCGAATADLQEAKDVPPTAAPKSWQGIGEHQVSYCQLYLARGPDPRALRKTETSASQPEQSNTLHFQSLPCRHDHYMRVSLAMPAWPTNKQACINTKRQPGQVQNLAADVQRFVAVA